MPGLEAAAQLLRGGQVGRDRGRWPSRVWMTKRPRLRAASSTRFVGAIARAQQRNVVAERLAEPAGIDEVALHVDDHERRGLTASNANS